MREIDPAPLLDTNTEKGSKLINTAEALYFSGNNKCTLVYFANGEILETHHLIKWYEKLLPDPLFCRCHKSFIVNCACIHCVNGKNFVLKNDVMIPISATYREYALYIYELFTRYGKPDVSGVPSKV